MKNIYLLIFILILANFSNAQNPKIEIITTFGIIELEIYEDKAPVTAKNFLHHVDLNTFKEACFYRVVRMDNQGNRKTKIEVIQGGLFHDSIVDQIPTIIHENTKQTGIMHTDGVISMARNQPGSASTEFFICIGKQASLDYGGMRNSDGQGFAAFGKVINGMDVVRQIQLQKDKGQMLLEKIKILSLKCK